MESVHHTRTQMLIDDELGAMGVFDTEPDPSDSEVSGDLLKVNHGLNEIIPE